MGTIATHGVKTGPVRTPRHKIFPCKVPLGRCLQGYATATNPLGPWKKYAGNPILPSLPMYSTGHGSIANSPDGSQTCYVHHGRPSATGGPRKEVASGLTSTCS